MIYNNLIQDEWLSELIDKSKIFIQKEYKKKNEPLYQFIFDYIKLQKQELLISNLDLLLYGSIQDYNKIIEIYTLEPNIVADDLFKKLCGKHKYYAMRIESFDNYYSIEYETLQFIRILKINQYKDISLLNFILPVKIESIYIFPPILELIDLYKNLYNPEYIDDWGDIIVNIKKIKTLTDKNITDTIKSKKGGDNEKNISKCSNCKEERSKLIGQIKEIIIDFVKTFNDYIFVHDIDYEVKKKIKLISKNNIQVDFERLNNYLDKIFNKEITIIYKKKNLFIGKDLRIIKYTFYIEMSKYGNKWSKISKPFLDLFNNASYELIPYVIDDNTKLKIAHPWVQIRFYYIEIWNILAAAKLNIIDKDSEILYITQLLKDINDYNSKKDQMLVLKKETMPYNYFGIYFNEHRSYKQSLLLQKNNIKLYC